MGSTNGNGNNGHNGKDQRQNGQGKVTVLEMVEGADWLLKPEEVQAPEQSFEIVYLDPTQLHFSHEGETLTLSTDDGRFYPRVTLRRCFPLSGEESLILVRRPETQDEEREIGVIAEGAGLDPSSAAAVTRELRLHYFVPVIRRIVAIHEEFGFLYWTVETDRGIKEFIMRDNIVSSTRDISRGRWLLIDINQARFEIRDEAALDPRSRKLLNRYLLL